MIFASSRRIIQHLPVEPIVRTRSWYPGGPVAFLERGCVMPGIKYYLRQANAFLSLAESTADASLRARYRMMAERFRGMASESTEKADGAADRRPVIKEAPINLE
jgi:hypothetical protein